MNKRKLGIAIIIILFVTIPYQVDFVMLHKINHGLWLHICLNVIAQNIAYWYLVFPKK